MAIEVNAQMRKEQGTGASRRLRKSGRVPAVLYGGRQDPVNIDLDHKSIYLALRQEKFHASVLTLQLDGNSEQVLLRAFSMHPWRPLVQHVDFQRVHADEPLHMKVPLHFVNAEISPAVKGGGAVVSHVMNEVDIECLPARLPEFITVDLKEMTAGSSLHLRQLQFPDGVKPVTRRNENPVVVTAQVPRAIVEEEKPEEEATPASAVPAAKQPDKPDAAAKAGAPGEKGAEKGGDKGGDKGGGKGGKK
jgi:large subunit ribosomal protein L25